MRGKNKKEDLNEALTSYMNSQFESVKTLKKTYYFFSTLLFSYFFLQVYFFEFVLNSLGKLGGFALIVLVAFIFVKIFLDYHKLKDIALSNSNLGYNLFKLKFGDEYDQWLKHNEDAGNELLSDVIAHCKNRKDLKDALGNSEIRYLYFRNGEGYHENVSQYIDTIAIVNSTYTYNGYKIYEDGFIEYFWIEKKIMDRRKNSMFPF